MGMKRTLVLLGLLLLFSAAAEALYRLPEEPEYFFYLIVEPGAWRLQDQTLVLRDKSVEVDELYFTHYSSDGSANCTGTSGSFVREEFAKCDPNGELLVRITKLKSRFIVIGVSPLDSTYSYKTASEYGNLPLMIGPAKVRELGEARYYQELKKMSDQGWETLSR